MLILYKSDRNVRFVFFTKSSLVEVSAAFKFLEIHLNISDIVRVHDKNYEYIRISSWFGLDSFRSIHLSAYA